MNPDEPDEVQPEPELNADIRRSVFGERHFGHGGFCCSLDRMSSSNCSPQSRQVYS